MKVSSLLTLTALVLAVWSVFIEDALTKNWIRYNHGQMSGFQLTNSSDLLAVTDSNQLINFKLDYKLSEAQMVWKVDVPFDFDYSVNFDSVITYNDNYVYIWDILTGAVIEYHKLGVKSVHKAFNGFIILAEKTLYYADRNGTVEIPGFEDVKAIYVSEIDDGVNIITNSMKLIKLSKELEVQTEDLSSLVNFNKIIDFKFNQIVLPDGIFDVSTQKFINKNKNLQLFADNVSYSYVKDDFRLFNGDKVVLEDKFSTLKIVGNQIVVDEADGRKVLDLSKFLETFDESSIYLDTYNSSGFEQEYTFDSSIYSVSVGENISISVFEPLKEVARVYNFKLLNFELAIPQALLINKPESKQTLDSIQHLIDEVEQNDLVTRWLKRTQRHMKELVKYGLSFISKVKPDKVSISNPYDLEKLLIFVDIKSLVAVDSLDGNLVWKQPISEGLIELQETENGLINLIYPNKIVVVSPRDGSILETNEKAVVYSPEFTYLKQTTDDTLQSYKFINNSLHPLWKFHNLGKIIKVQVKPAHPHSSVGIPLHDKSVFYKYLNDDLVTIITHDKTTTVSIIDGTLGALVYSVEHDPEEIIDLQSINLIMDDNWIIYSYFVKSPKYEQRITVIDLFKSQKPTKDSLSMLSPSIKSYIYPERIVNMTSTYTKMGITLKSIIILTETGDLVEIPKFILNSRRIDDRVLTPDDFKDDFRMSQYEPIIPRNNYQVLNHQYTLDVDHSDNNIILVKDTKLESTSIVCFINSQTQFCTRVQPSLSFDILSESFDKFKLIITIIFLIVGYFITKPMVTKKNLNSEWIDNSL